MKSNTIAAIATPMTNSGIGIIRISGDEALDIIEKVFKPKKKDKKIKDVKTYTAHYGHVYDESTLLDECIVLVMKGPHSPRSGRHCLYKPPARSVLPCRGAGPAGSPAYHGSLLQLCRADASSGLGHGSGTGWHHPVWGRSQRRGSIPGTDTDYAAENRGQPRKGTAAR